ncbi:MAG: isoleucine--tRNA ligase [Dehalococcoidia bacterium]|nr:isoleucine--tRNA ligase [Dehalococcoidia bacterium]|tara:strand:+ start:4149 stop:7277 length:3129 start_codon:yes stop_codon:yes gene_type:complete
MKNKKQFPDLNSKPNFSEIENEIINFWDKDETFNKTLNKGQSSEFVFYDGPPFANGLPHYGHLLTGFVKDIIPRFQTMLGNKVDRRFGWDCHGLPAEMESEKELGVSGRAEIIKFGVENFNEHCQKSVMKYTQEWEKSVNRQARWVDFKNDYKTMDISYMESVIWAFKELWKKGLIYEKDRVMPYSWKAETPISNFETRLDNSYREREDPAVTVKFRLDEETKFTNTSILIWTTTPWTLPSNLAVAVNSELDYVLISNESEKLIIGEFALSKYDNELSGYRVEEKIKGSDLVGLKYCPVFNYFVKQPNAFKVLSAEFVNTEEGTGIVHMAPGFGEDDQAICEDNDIKTVCPVDSRGQFTSEISDYSGQLVFDANPEIIKKLKLDGNLLKRENYKHNYPHSWRTDEPLIYKTLNSWYVEVSKFRDSMVSNNQKINWIPDHIKDGAFGNWLAGARDWSISRNRFWGTPIPVWKSDDPNYPRIDVYGSLDEIEADFGVRPDNLHRPYIDELTRPNPDDPTGKSTMRRVEEVFDCWFESGSMPFAQVHYPFENKEWFESHFPADFIVEYIAQTRGWFYTLMVLSTALFDKPPFLNAIGHGVVVDEKGLKLSKRLNNYPEPEEVWKNFGADALRWFLVSSPILRGQNLMMDSTGSGIDSSLRQVLVPLWNSVYFFNLYCNLEKYKPKLINKGNFPIDKYILSKSKKASLDVKEFLNNYDITGACTAVSEFIDTLNNWYIRRSRNRFWAKADTSSATDAYDTLYTVLNILLKIIAPLSPLISEKLFMNLNGGKSVHLENWPDVHEIESEDKLIKEMDIIRKVVSTSLSIRKINKIRVRQPLSLLTIQSNNGNWVEEYFELIKEEVNVKNINIEEVKNHENLVQLKINPRLLGPRIGKKVQECIQLAKEGKWKEKNGIVVIGDFELNEGEYEIETVINDDPSIQSIEGTDFIVEMDLSVDEKLKREGVARDLVRAVQTTRREKQFDVSDFIKINLTGDKYLIDSVIQNLEFVKNQILAKEVVFDDKDNEFDFQEELNGIRAAFKIIKLV